MFRVCSAISLHEVAKTTMGLRVAVQRASGPSDNIGPLQMFLKFLNLIWTVCSTSINIYEHGKNKIPFKKPLESSSGILIVLHVLLDLCTT